MPKNPIDKAIHETKRSKRNCGNRRIRVWKLTNIGSGIEVKK